MPTGHPASFPPECWHFAVSILQATELPRGSRPFWMRALCSTKTWKCFWNTTRVIDWSLLLLTQPNPGKTTVSTGGQGPKNWTKHIPKDANNVAPANCQIPDSGVWTFGVYAKFLRNIFQNIPNKYSKIFQNKYSNISQNKYSKIVQNKYSKISQNKYSKIFQNKYSKISQNKYSKIVQNIMMKWWNSWRSPSAERSRHAPGAPPSTLWTERPRSGAQANFYRS